MCWLSTPLSPRQMNASSVADQDTRMSPARTKTEAGKTPSTRLNSELRPDRFWIRITGRPHGKKSDALNARPLTYSPVSVSRHHCQPHGRENGSSSSTITAEGFSLFAFPSCMRSRISARDRSNVPFADSSWESCRTSLPCTASARINSRSSATLPGAVAICSKCCTSLGGKTLRYFALRSFTSSTALKTAPRSGTRPGWT